MAPHVPPWASSEEAISADMFPGSRSWIRDATGKVTSAVPAPATAPRNRWFKLASHSFDARPGAPLNPAIPADVKDQVAKLEGQLKAGTFHPFAGPVKDQDGKERVAAGKTMTDDELGKMDYYVEGVASKLPKN